MNKPKTKHHKARRLEGKSLVPEIFLSVVRDDVSASFSNTDKHAVAQMQARN
jgi:hypothetical protein